MRELSNNWQAAARPALWLLASFCLTVLAISVGSTFADPPEPSRIQACVEGGQTILGDRLTDWSLNPPAIALDGHPLPVSEGTLRSIHFLRTKSPGQLGPFVELATGDRLPGRVIRFVDGGQLPYQSQRDHVVVRTTLLKRPAQQSQETSVRVISDHVRRIVWEPTGQHGEPGTIIDQDGRHVHFRALRWNEQSVTILTVNGRRTIDFSQMAELYMPRIDPWPFFFDELALLSPTAPSEAAISPTADGQWMQIETSAGIIATTSWQRTRNTHQTSGLVTQGIQPVWSLDTLWIPVQSISWWRFFAPGQVPLSRLQPSNVIQRSPLAQQGRPWQRNRNVEGGLLRSGPGTFSWGFGVHAHNELHFPLPDINLVFHSQFGLDHLSDDGGCVQAFVKLQTAQVSTRARTKTLPKELAKTPLIIGARTISSLTVPIEASLSGNQQLILTVDHAHDQRPAGADPLDIRDSADWLDPTLDLQRSALMADTAERIARQIAAWDRWNVLFPQDELVQFTNSWDELAGAKPAFHLAVTLQGREPLRLAQEYAPGPNQNWLVLGVSRNLASAEPPQIQVSADGRQLGSFDIPLLNRDHVDLSPLIVPIPSAANASSKVIRFEIHQSAGLKPTPVLWHSINFTRDHPTRFTLFDDIGTWSSTDDLADSHCTPCNSDAHSGQASVLVTPSNEFRLTLDYPIEIRERPVWGEYRYLRFAFRKRGGGRIRLRLITSNAEQPNWSYVAGKASVEEAQAKRAGAGKETRNDKDVCQIWTDELPDRWIVITRDLARDFGPHQLTGIAISTPDGQDAKFDAIVAARSLRDLNATD